MTTTNAPSAKRTWSVSLANGVWLGDFAARSSTEACEQAWENHNYNAFEDGDLQPMPKGINARLV